MHGREQLLRRDKALGRWFKGDKLPGFGNPRFTLTGFGSDGNYHLISGSPAIDAGTTSGAPMVDLDGITRPQGGGFDIGAYER
ncbi:MAG: choice-of-anchor Q domain-containing protein [candidate division WOR-3 bacterium]